MDVNMADLAIVNLYERLDEDLYDWQTQLEQIRKDINAGELETEMSGGDGFRDARRKIKSLLDEMEQTRQFVAFKQAHATAEQITSDVEGAFEVPTGLYVDNHLDIDLDRLDEDRLE
jgi:site-specific DNA-adenine methylase